MTITEIQRKLDMNYYEASKFKEQAELLGLFSVSRSNRLRFYEVEFDGVYPVGNCLIIAAESKEQATQIAAATIAHTDKFEVKEMVIDHPKPIVYLSGDY